MQETIKKYAFKDGLKLEFEIIDLQTILQLKGDIMTVPHRAQFYHIIWIEKGKGTHYVDFKPISIKNNTIIFVPQNSVNLYDIAGKYEGQCIVFTDSFFAKNNEDMQFLHSSMLYSDLYDTALLKVSPQLSDLRVTINAMQTEFIRTHDVSQYSILHNMLHIFLLQAEREMRKQGFKELKPSANLDYLVLFKDLLEKNFREEKTVSKYAAELSISEKQLQKATKTLLDKTPKQIIDERILLEGKRLLVHSNQSIKEIAYELGYDEPTNFIKYFRKHTDKTPSEFREQY
ncbi:AraC family transcriptional regulator [Labilibacter marinus]|uniref:AraC family transcriptional regulator n=1 Tax=Labilibacter marinus TaxID=1477105 RepID=UPI00094FECE2|nr:helix-turn-helix domain-containing protein [Labilibacter marinus]